MFNFSIVPSPAFAGLYSFAPSFFFAASREPTKHSGSERAISGLKGFTRRREEESEAAKKIWGAARI
jgi:hypothetical protein